MNQEKIDLENFKIKRSNIQNKTFNAIRNALRMNESDLRNSGFKTIESAAIGHYKYAANEIEKLEKEFFKKYPDLKP